MLEPIMLRSNSQRDSFAWKRGETTASAGELMAFRAIANASASRRELALLQAVRCDRVNIHLTTRTKSNPQTTGQEN